MRQFRAPSRAPEISMQNSIKVDRGMTTVLYGYLLYDEHVIVMEACDGARSASIFALQWRASLFWRYWNPVGHSSFSKAISF